MKFSDVRNVEFMHDIMSDARRTHKNQKFFYVDSSISGSATASGRRWENALPTIGAAYSLTTAARGDTIFCAPFHSETRTAVLTVSNSYVQIEGKKLGNQRPIFTINGAVDLFSLEGAGCALKGLQLTTVTTGGTALVNCGAANLLLEDLYMIPSAGLIAVTDVITVASGANSLHIRNCRSHNTVVAVNSFISIEAAVARFELDHCYFSGNADTAGIIDSAAATQLWFHDTTIRTVGTTIPVVTLDSNPTGTVERFAALGTHTTLATNANWGNLLRLSEIRLLEATDASVQATDIIPALDTD